MYVQENSLNPKQFFAKSGRLQEKSLNPKQFFAKSDQLQEFKIKPKSILSKKIKNKKHPKKCITYLQEISFEFTSNKIP